MAGFFIIDKRMFVVINFISPFQGFALTTYYYDGLHPSLLYAVLSGLKHLMPILNHPERAQYFFHKFLTSAELNINSPERAQ